MIQSQGMQNKFHRQMEKLKGFLVSQRDISPIEDEMEGIRRSHTPMIGQQTTSISYNDDESPLDEKIKQIGVKSKSFDEEYEMGRKLGEGTHGIVRLCWKKDNKNILYAVKIIQTHDEEMLDIVRQTFINSTLINSAYIAKCYKLFIDINIIYLVMEYVPYDNLELLIRSHHKFTELEMQKIICQLLKAVRCLHSGGICHRDIKPDNILINQNDFSIKLLDLGVSRRFVSYNNITFRYNRKLMLTVTGNIFYRAPEIISGSTYGYSQQIDIWSIGVILYQCLTGSLPFFSDSISEITTMLLSSDCLQKVFSNEKFTQLSSSCRDLIRRLLMWNPLKRLTASEALKHIWIPSIHTPMKTIIKKSSKDDMDGSKISHNSDILNKSLINSATILNQELQNTLIKSKHLDSIMETNDEVSKSQKNLSLSIKIKKDKEFNDFKTKLQQFKLETSTKIYKRNTNQQINTIQLIGALDEYEVNTSVKLDNDEEDDLFGLKVCGSQHSMTQFEEQDSKAEKSSKLDPVLLSELSKYNL